MLRIATILLGFFPLLFITTIKSEDVKITQQTQSKIYQGEEFVVEVKVEKGDIEGFAKYQLDVPQGFTAEQIDVLGATFTFDEGTIKVIWLALPSKNEFTFTYKIKVADDVPNQSLELGGRLSYLEDNNRMISEATKLTVQIGDSKEEILAAKPKEPATASVSRLVTPLEDGTYEVEVKVEKSNIDGFSKVEDVYPNKYDISPIDEQNGVFSFVKTKVKFVWMSTPEADNFSVKYKVDPKGEAIDFTAVTGEYSFLDDNETKKVEIIDESGLPLANATESTTETEEVPAEEVEKTEAAIEEKAEEIKEEIAVAEEVVEETKKPKKEKKKEDVIETNNVEEMATTEITEEAPISEATPAEVTETADNSSSMENNIPSPQEAVEYRVQILAGKNLVGKPYFKKNHQYEENFITENHNGLVKYTTGQYNVYREARDRREEINGKYVLPGPFVTAYNNGQRITVQEALMITNQKWFK